MWEFCNNLCSHQLTFIATAVAGKRRNISRNNYQIKRVIHLINIYENVNKMMEYSPNDAKKHTHTHARSVGNLERKRWSEKKNYRNKPQHTKQ